MSWNWFDAMIIQIQVWNDVFHGKRSPYVQNVKKPNTHHSRVCMDVGLCPRYSARGGCNNPWWEGKMCPCRLGRKGQNQWVVSFLSPVSDDSQKWEGEKCTSKFRCLCWCWINIFIRNQFCPCKMAEREPCPNSIDNMRKLSKGTLRMEPKKNCNNSILLWKNNINGCTVGGGLLQW